MLHLHRDGLPRHTLTLSPPYQGTGGVAKEEEEVLDEESQRRDQVVKGAIEGLIREYASELNAPSQDGENHPRNKKRKEKKEEVGPPAASLGQFWLDQVWPDQVSLVQVWLQQVWLDQVSSRSTRSRETWSKETWSRETARRRPARGAP